MQHPQNGDGTTTSLIRHLKNCQSFIKYKASGPKEEVAFFKKGMSNATNEITTAFVHDQLLKFFITGNIPFAQAENPEFKTLLSLIKIDGKQYQSPSRKVLRANLTSWADLAREELKTLLTENDSKISLALDCWTSRRRHAYIGM